MSTSIEVSNLYAVYEDRGTPFTALQDVSFSIPQGQFVSIIGASGCGKSTLLSILEGLMRPSSGTVLVQNKPVTGPGPERNVVFQQYSLFPWLTALQNVTFALKQSQKRLSKNQREMKARELLKKVSLEGFEHRFPKELSGGQQQRVAIARALAGEGSVLLMDEPFGAIDARNRSLLQDLLLELWEGEPGDGRKTVVFVTHDLDEAILLSDRILMMKANPGRIHADFKVPLPRPRHRLKLINNPVYIKFRSEVSKVFFENDTKAV